MMEKDNFLVKAGLFIIVTIVCILLVNQIYIHFILEKKFHHRAEKTYQDYITGLEERKIMYAFFGASHTRDGINPEYILDSYNFADSQENYIQTYFKMKKIVEIDKVNIDSAILEIDMPTFSSALHSNGGEFTDLGMYAEIVPYSEMKNITQRSYANIFLISKFPMLGNGVEFRYISYPTEKIYRGHTIRNENIVNADKNTLAINAYQNQFEDFDRISNLTLLYFIKTLEFAKEKNISIYFIIYPTSEYYAKFMNEKNITKEDYYSTVFSNIDKVLGKEYRVLNYYDIFFNNTEYFANIDHLNNNGSIILSKKIDFDLRNISLTNTEGSEGIVK